MKTQPKQEKSLISSEDFYLQSWLWLCFGTLIFYLPFFFNFMWGNHDWGWIKEDTPLLSGLFEGRFSQFILQNLLYNGKILPILTLMTALSIFNFGLILLFKLWKLPHKNHLYILAGLNIVCAPYTLSWLYFAFITLSCLSWITVIIFAYTLLHIRPISQHPNLLLTAAVILFTLALGGYPPIINLICLLFCSFALTDLCLKRLTVKSLIKKYIPYISAVTLSLICFGIILYLLKKYHYQYDTYNTAEISLKDIFPKLLYTFKEGIKQFFITTSFISYTYKYLNFCLFLLALTLLCHKLPKTIPAILSFIILLSGLIFSSVITTFISSNPLYVQNSPRIEFFGILYIYGFSSFILIKFAPQLIKNISCLTLAFLLFYNLTTISYAQKVWQLGFVSEMKLSERILTRIEEYPEFNSRKKYTFIQSGTTDFRSRFYTSKLASTQDGYTLTAPYIPWHLPSKAYSFYYPTDFFGDDFDIFWQFVDKSKLNLSPDMIKYLANTSEVWPHPNSIYIDPNTIILTLSHDGQMRARNWLQYNL